MKIRSKRKKIYRREIQFEHYVAAGRYDRAGLMQLIYVNLC